MEFLIMHFPRSRRVLVDDEFNGRTDDLIEIEAGRHVVSFGATLQLHAGGANNHLEGYVRTRAARGEL